ncbi:MAG: amidase [Acidilobus sp.]
MEVGDALERARRLADLNAVVTLNDKAEVEARAAERRGLRPVPIAVKDIIYTKGLRTTMGSRLFKDYAPTYDASVVARLKRAGLIIIGKTNTHEFASGATTTSSVFGPTRNPLDKERIAGGSSGGSAAAVAAGIVDVAIGTDTAGSVRIPASLCGVIGFRPSSGSTPKRGVFPLSPTFDEVGILASSIDAVEEVFKVIADRKGRRAEARRQLRLGVPEGLIMAERDVERAFYDIVTRLNASSVKMPLTEGRGREAFTVIRLSEASAVHLPFKDVWGEYFPDVRRLIERGLTYRAADYVGALEVMRRAREEFMKVMRDLEALLLPSTAVPAPRIDEVLGREDGPIRDLLTGDSWLAPLVGAPAISLPLMRVGGLPVGLQVIGKPGQDLELIDVARALLNAV